MITPELKALLAWRKELEVLFHEAQYTSPGHAGVQEIVRIARRAIEIIKAWPEEFWPLEDAEDIWPDQESTIGLLEQAITGANTYMGTYSLNDFDVWHMPNKYVFGALYYFRNKELDEDPNED
jgi:hypothetical protein